MTKRSQSKLRIISAAGEAFRKNGFAGIGVDGLAKRAELTSGAFYFHFASKLDAFLEAIQAGLDELRCGIEHFQEHDGPGWLKSFADFYLGYKRTCELENACTLPALTSEVERAGDEARAIYEKKLLELADSMSKGLAEGNVLSNREQALVLLALLSGGVNMARAVKDRALSEEIAEAVQKAVFTIGSLK